MSGKNRLQETRRNMAGYFCLFSAVIIPSLEKYEQYVAIFITLGRKLDDTKYIFLHWTLIRTVFDIIVVRYNVNFKWNTVV